MIVMGFKNGILECPLIQSGPAGPRSNEYVGFGLADAIASRSEEVVIVDQHAVALSKLEIDAVRSGAAGV